MPTAILDKDWYSNWNALGVAQRLSGTLPSNWLAAFSSETAHLSIVPLARFWQVKKDLLNLVTHPPHDYSMPRGCILIYSTGRERCVLAGGEWRICHMTGWMWMNTNLSYVFIFTHFCWPHSYLSRIMIMKWNIISCCWQSFYNYGHWY